jgi:hypothetical protein
MSAVEILKPIMPDIYARILTKLHKCECWVCDCENLIDFKKDSFFEWQIGSIACGNCKWNHGSCLEQSCQHIGRH